jgi:hypothetical protein
MIAPRNAAVFVTSIGTAESKLAKPSMNQKSSLAKIATDVGRAHTTFSNRIASSTRPLSTVGGAVRVTCRSGWRGPSRPSS